MVDVYKRQGLKSLNRAADTLSTLLAQEVKELNERQKAARRENTPDPGMMKGLKEATAVLKDLAGVVKTLNDQGTELEGTECGAVSYTHLDVYKRQPPPIPPSS